MRKTSRRYALSQFAIHGEMMMMRYKDNTTKFEYFDIRSNQWEEASVPQWEEDTQYRIVTN